MKGSSINSMLTLCIDTAYKYLTCVLINDDRILASYSKECFKRQSEEVFSALDEVFKAAQVEKTAIDSICITKGPGSYTGVRIAMTIAKTMGEMLKCDVYTISTLQLYAGGRPNCMVLMDARASRAYLGIYDEGMVVIPDTIMELDKVETMGCNLIGDGQLIGRSCDFGDIPADFLNTKAQWHKVEEIAFLTPEYLKESEAYHR